MRLYTSFSLAHSLWQYPVSSPFFSLACTCYRFLIASVWKFALYDLASSRHYITDKLPGRQGILLSAAS